MKRLVRQFIPNKVVNYGRHLPTAFLANLRYRFPSKGLKVIGVTGTDGKTTTTNMIYQILKLADKKVSMISTINAVIGETKYETGFHVTSPSPFDIQKYLKLAKLAGSEYIVLEITSHALDQFRAWGIRFDIGVITNITHEHLDYHKSFENYFKAKAKLIKDAKVAVINRGESHFEKLSKCTKGKVVSFGLTKNAHFNPQKFPLKLKLPGEFNILNAEAAAAVGVSLGIDAKVIKNSLENFETLEGRMDQIENNLGIKIFVDFAHTPNALEQALKTLHSLKTARPSFGGNDQRLISIFGCASERDDAKRPIMEKISAEIADITILTDEDPRFEDSMKIINEIAEGAIRGGAKEGENLFKEPDRKKAIQIAVKMAKKGDVIGIFGKGHEKSMNYQGVERSWSDKKAVKEVLDGSKV